MAGVLLNQAVKRLHEANGDPGPGLDLQLRHAVGKVLESLETADDTAPLPNHSQNRRQRDQRPWLCTELGPLTWEDSWS